MANKITTIFDAEVRGFRDGINKIKTDMAEAEGGVGKLKAGWKGAATEFRNSRAAQGAALGAVAVFAKQAIGAASDLEESVNAVTVTYGNAADAVLKIGENSAKSFGLSQSEFNGMAVQFSSFVEQVTGPGGDVAATLNELTGRAADFASVMNLDVAEAARVFQSGLAGETEPLKKFGINLSAAAVEAYALENGLVASKSEMTEAIKVTARYQLLMEETSATQGDFANTSDSLANQQRILSATMEDLSASIGGELIPAMSEAAGIAIKLSDGLDMLPGGGHRKGNRLKDGLTLLTGGFQELTKSMLEDADAAREAAVGADLVADSLVRAGEGRARSREGVQGHTEDLEAETEALEEAGEAVETLTDQFSDLLGVLDDNDAFRSLEDSIDDVIDAQEDAADSAGRTAREQESAARKAAGAVDDLKREVISYADEVGNIPAKQVSDIIAMIDQGALAEAEAALARLERQRTAVITARTIITNAPSSDFGHTPQVSSGNPNSGQVGIGARGGIVTQATQAIIGEAGPEAVIPLDQMPGASPLGGGKGGGVTIMPGAIQVTSIGSPTPELKRMIMSAVESELRRTGRTI